MIQYPLALNGLPYGVFREFPHYNDKELENHRQSLLTKPRYFFQSISDKMKRIALP